MVPRPQLKTHNIRVRRLIIHQCDLQPIGVDLIGIDIGDTRELQTQNRRLPTGFIEKTADRQTREGLIRDIPQGTDIQAINVAMVPVQQA